MNNQFEIGAISPELKPKVKNFEKLLKSVPEECWRPGTTADDIRNLKENEQDITEIYEIAQMVLNAFYKLTTTDQTEDWQHLKEKAEQLKYNLEIMFPKLLSKQ